MIRIATVSPSYEVLASRTGYDLDQDGLREFMLWRNTGTQFNGPIDFFERNAAGGFQLSHVVDIPQGNPVAHYPMADLGDADGDGLSELLVRGNTGTQRSVRLYEALAPGGFPTTLVWTLVDASVPMGAMIADTDVDGLREVVIGGQTYNFDQRVAIYENDGDNTYHEILYHSFAEVDAQSLEVTQDLDGDGRPEILYGGLTNNNSKVLALESVGDDAYQQIWEADLLYEDGNIVNVEDIQYAGDLDGDGRREFLAGGIKTIMEPGQSFLSVLYVFEAVADNDFEVVATLVQPFGTLESEFSTTVADVDGDGRQEIVLGSGRTVRIYGNTGDNAWQEIWSGTSGNLFSIDAGDHDGDGLEEVIFQENGFTGIWEIDPADVADLDSDGYADAVDNCVSTANPGQEDADADGVGNVCDNCIQAANPGQGPAVFGQTLNALNPQKFVWTTALDVIYARGDLSLVSAYGTDHVQSLALASSFADSSIPPTGGGFYYLVRPNCPVGSWQSSLGAEPGRDASLP